MRTVCLQREDSHRQRLTPGRIVEHCHFEIAQAKDKGRQPREKQAASGSGDQDPHETAPVSRAGGRSRLLHGHGDLSEGHGARAQSNHQIAGISLGQQNGGFSPAIQSTAASWRGPNDPVIPVTSPADLFKKIFQGISPGAALDPAAEQIERQRLTEQRSVLDGVTQQINVLRGKLGVEDRAKLDEYFTGVRDLDTQVMKILAMPKLGGDGTCKLPAAAAGTSYVDKLTAFGNLVVKAFECDIARVISFTHSPVAAFGTANPNSYVPGFNGSGWHGSSHDDDVNHARVVQWHYKKVEALALQLKNSTLPGGQNLLDSTLISWGSGISAGAGHRMSGLHNVLIGKGGGAFKAGVRFSTGVPLSHLWNTLLHGFGLPGRSFGSGGPGIFPQLLV